MLVVWNIHPLQAGLGGLAIFYLTLCLALMGTLTLFGVLYRVLLSHRKDVIAREVRVAFRHAVFLSLVSTGALVLSGQGGLRWWMIAMMILGISGIEYLFLLREESRRS